MEFQGVTVYFSLNSGAKRAPPCITVRRRERLSRVSERFSNYSASQMMEAMRPVWPSRR